MRRIFRCIAYKLIIIPNAALIRKQRLNGALIRVDLAHGHTNNIITQYTLIRLRACLHQGWGPQIGEVTCGGSPHLSCKCDQIKMRDYMDRQVTPPKLAGVAWRFFGLARKVIKVSESREPRALPLVRVGFKRTFAASPLSSVSHKTTIQRRLHLSGLHHLTGVPHLHVNRPLFQETVHFCTILPAQACKI